MCLDVNKKHDFRETLTILIEIMQFFDCMYSNFNCSRRFLFLFFDCSF